MRAYLELLRLPAVFTAMVDIVLGFHLTHASFEPLPKFLGLLISSCCLYLSGMVFNDVFDVVQDASERPTRPIPSGRVARRSAAILGSVLMLLGVGSAWTVTALSGETALVLVAAILAYDGYLKRTLLGPIGMGLCRFLNLMLGASGGDFATLADFWAMPQVAVAAGLGTYIVGVTWFARTEAKMSARTGLMGGLMIMDAGIAALAWLVAANPRDGQQQAPLILLGVIAASLNMRAMNAITDPSPPQVQGLIKLFLLNYVTLSATLVYWQTGNPVLAFGTACLVLPAMLISRLIAMT
ncbi:MAG: UbiA family prenyltransferase [Planctomycetaceae bacterium]|nr:UbiA family prenyltransferase [Planctomycetaceae bacterium]